MERLQVSPAIICTPFDLQTWVAEVQPEEDWEGLRASIKLSVWKQRGGQKHCKAAKGGER